MPCLPIYLMMKTYNKSDVLETVYRDEAKLRSDFEEMKLQRLGLNDRVVEALYKNAQIMAENRHKKAAL